MMMMIKNDDDDDGGGGGDVDAGNDAGGDSDDDYGNDGYLANGGDNKFPCVQSCLTIGQEAVLKFLTLDQKYFQIGFFTIW